MKLLESPVNPGDQLDHYRIDSVVSRSAAASVFRAVDLRTSTDVAIKIPLPDMQNDPTFTDRFNREVEIGEVLDHPSIIKVIPDRERTGIYMVMEWFDGKTLRDILKQDRTIAPGRAARIVAAVCDALEYIHGHGIVHGDIRPENVMVGAGDRIKLIDFGGAIKAAARRLTMTKLSQAIGTSEYVSPEELKGRRGDARSDIYALGVMLYEMLTGKMPFQGVELYDRIRNYPIPPREMDPGISPQLQEVIYRALEPDPQNRYKSAHDFSQDLGHLEAVGVADRVEIRDWKKKRRKASSKLAIYVLIALIPIVLFALLLYVARR